MSEFDEFSQQAQMILGGAKLDKQFLENTWDGADKDLNRAINHLLGMPEKDVVREGQGGGGGGGGGGHSSKPDKKEKKEKHGSSKKSPKQEPESSPAPQDFGASGGFGCSGGCGGDAFGGGFGGQPPQSGGPGGFGDGMTSWGGQTMGSMAPQMQMPMQMQQTMPPEMYQQMPQHMQQQMPSHMQSQMPPQMQQQMPPQMQQQMPPNMPQTLPPQMHQQMHQQAYGMGGPSQQVDPAAQAQRELEELDRQIAELTKGQQAPSMQMPMSQPTFGSGMPPSYGSAVPQSYGSVVPQSFDDGYDSDSDSDNDWWHQAAPPSGPCGAMGPASGCGGSQMLGPAPGSVGPGAFGTLQSASQFNTLPHSGGMGHYQGGPPSQQYGNGPPMGTAGW